MNQKDAAWAKKTADIAGFASPWVTKPHVKAHAYPVALNFSDALKGFKGKRTRIMFHMDNSCEAGNRKCVYCGGKLNQPLKEATREHGNNVRSVSTASDKVDKHSTWFFVPGKGIVGGMHYLCSWANLLGDIHAMAQAA